MTERSLVPLLWALVVVLLLVGVAVGSSLLRRLKRLHPRTFKELGEPSLLVNMSTGNQLRLMKFIWLRRDRPLLDPKLSAMVVFHQVVTIVCFLLIAVAGILGGKDGSI